MSERAHFVLSFCLTWTIMETVFSLFGGGFDVRSVFMVWMIVLYCAWQMPNRGEKKSHDS